MTPFEKYLYWVVVSDYDFATARDLIGCKRWAYVSFLCQQAVERLLKGMFVCHTGKEAPKSHNIPFLMNKLAEHPRFQDTVPGNRFHKEKSEFEDFALDLMFYYMTDYPFSYKSVMNRFIEGKTALEIYEKTEKMITWLKSFQAETN